MTAHEYVEGQTVYFKPKKTMAEIILVDGDYIVLELPNGAEFDCSPEQLEKEPPAVAPSNLNENIREDKRYERALRNIQTGDPDLIMAGQLEHRVATIALSAIGGSAAPWAQLSAKQKMNYIAVGVKKTVEKLLEEFAK